MILIVMPNKSIEEIKNCFNEGDRPTANDFSNLIESCHNSLVVGATDIKAIEVLTQNEYDTLETKESNILYLIKNPQ